MAKDSNFEKKEKKKKNEPQHIKLPNVSHMVKRQRHIAQGKADYEGFYKVIASIVIGALILFVLMGGVNQRKFLVATYNFGNALAERFGKIFNFDKLDVTEDGIYLNPEKTKEDIKDIIEDNKETEENVEKEVEEKVEDNQ